MLCFFACDVIFGRPEAPSLSGDGSQPERRLASARRGQSLWTTGGVSDQAPASQDGVPKQLPRPVEVDVHLNPRRNPPCAAAA